MGAEGGNPQQLTLDSGTDVSPAVSPDGRTIVFVSDRNDTTGLWSMDIDGSNPKQLTQDNLDVLPQVSPDGKWVVYMSLQPGKWTLWKVPLEGGDPVQITHETSFAHSISPDGRFLSFQVIDEQLLRLRTVITPFAGGQPVKELDIIPRPFIQVPITWAEDGRGLIYSDMRDGISNLWVHPLDGGQPRQLTHFTSDLIFNYAWSRDGKQLAVARGTITSDVVLFSNFK